MRGIILFFPKNSPKGHRGGAFRSPADFTTVEFVNRRLFHLGTALAIVGSIFASAPLASAEGPSNLSLPIIYGAPNVGTSLGVATGTWNVAPTSFLYQWIRCSDTSTANCETIVGATSATYLLSMESVGKYVKVSVTGVSAGGGTTVQSGLTQMVSTAIVATSNPVLSGEISKGGILTSTSGTWPVAVSSIKFGWQRCTLATNGTCGFIDGAETSTYTTTIEDVGYFINSVVEAKSNVPGFTIGKVSSLATGPIASAPQQIGSASLSGEPIQGETLTANLGRIIASPKPEYSYQWQKCGSPDLSTCSNIVGATSNSYPLTSTLNGNYIRLISTIQNSLGGIIIPSNLVGPVVAPTSPMSISAATITSKPALGETVTATSGDWSGVPKPVITFQWLRCSDSTGSSCTEITNATGNSIVPSLEDLGKFLKVRITGKNRVGSFVLDSKISDQVDYKIRLITQPSVLGFGLVGIQLSSITPIFSENITDPFSYQWQSCTSNDAKSCSNIMGATTPYYSPVLSDEGKWIRVGIGVPGKTSWAYSSLGKDPIFPSVNSAASPTKPSTSSKPANVTITCIKGKLVKKVTAVNPKCPTGYKKK